MKHKNTSVIRDIACPIKGVEKIPAEEIQKTPAKGIKKTPAKGDKTRGAKRSSMAIPKRPKGIPENSHWDIKYMQNTTHSCIPAAPLKRLVKGLMQEFPRLDGEHYRLTEDGFNCIRDAAEAYMVSYFTTVNRICISQGRVQVESKDFKTAKDLCMMLNS